MLHIVALTNIDITAKFQGITPKPLKLRHQVKVGPVFSTPHQNDLIFSFKVFKNLFEMTSSFTCVMENKDLDVLLLHRKTGLK